MTSFVSSILHNSANKIESMSMLGSKSNNQKNKSKAKSNPQHSNLASRLAIHASTPVLTSSNNSSGGYYFHPQMSYSAEYIPAPPPYDTMQQQLQQQQLHSPTPTPSTSWTSEMSALAEKIKDDVTNSFKGSSKQSSTTLSSQQQQQNNIDRHSISQGMKLVSIAADEYEEGNETVALDIYLTGVDKILMALPNKTDINTKMAIREKLQSVEERVGILNLATSQKKIQQQQELEENDDSFDKKSTNSVINSFILSRIASTISTISSKAYQSATILPTSIIEVDDNDGVVPVMTSAPMPTIYIEGGGDAMAKFKRFGQYMIDITVTCAVLIKQSPLPDLISFMFGYLIQVLLWVDSQYHVMQKVQNLGIQCIKFGLQADEQYRLHEFISEGLYMMVAAGLKAAVAFKETPRYDEGQSNRTQQHIRNKSEPNFIKSSVDIREKNTTSRRNSDPLQQQQQKSLPNSPCSPPTPQKTRASWVWSRW